MKHGFERNIDAYRSEARNAVEGEDPESSEDAPLSPRQEALVGKAAEASQTPAEAQEEIYRLQEEKQRIMRGLKEDLQALDRKDHVWRTVFGERLVKKEGDRYLVRGRDGDPDLPITEGELLTDLVWDKRYSLDRSVDRLTRKKYLVAKATQQIARLFDRQIATDRGNSAQVHPFKQQAYKKREKSSGYENGFLAEKMVRNFLAKLSIDEGLDFEILETNAYLDVEKKMDFVIRRKERLRGVDVEEDAEAQRIGVQFTTNVREDAQQMKKDQIERVKGRGIEQGIDDLVLVTIPSDEVRETFRAWQKDQKPGGPDKLWSQETKREIFSKVMQEIMKPEEIAEQWARIGEDTAREQIEGSSEEGAVAEGHKEPGASRSGDGA